MNKNSHIITDGMIEKVLDGKIPNGIFKRKQKWELVMDEMKKSWI